jgi:transcriptional regulator with XRE-family HTH domain
MPKPSVPAIIDRIMQEQDLTPRQVAEKLGVAVSTVYQWQKGRSPRLGVRVRMLKNFDIAPAELGLKDMNTTAHAVVNTAANGVANGEDTSIAVAVRSRRGLAIEMQVTPKTALRVLQVLLAEETL